MWNTSVAFLATGREAIEGVYICMLVDKIPVLPHGGIVGSLS
jgi:hypothetical protein